VPASTEPRIEEFCAKIRDLCRTPHTPQGEAELRKLAQELRVAIKHHVRMAKSSLSAKQSAINKRDPDTTMSDSD
jgi:hypothetical protein